MKRRPESDEYAAYYSKYVGTVQNDDIVAVLTEQKTGAVDFLKKIVWEKWELSYAPDKWTLTEVLLHLIDSERIFAYRALRIARGDTTPLPGFEQNDYIPNADAANRTPVSVVDEYAAVREATIQLFQNFNDAMWARRGVAAGHEVTPLALAFIIAGHENHHLEVIREKYL